MEIALILFGVFAVSLILGNPVAIALGVASACTLFYLNIDFVYLVQVAYTSIDSFPLMAVPTFVLAGFLMEKAGMSDRLVRFAEALAGRFTGGLGAATILACAFFGAITGSGPAATAAVGMLMIPAMLARNYDKGFAAAVTASAGGLGIVIPPSIPMIIYGIVGSQSITKLFVAGIIPGLLIALCLLMANYIVSKHLGFEGSQVEFSSAHVWKTFKEGIWSIFAPVIILGGIYSGIFTPTESAVVAINYTLICGFFIHKELTFKKVTTSLANAAELTGVTLVIMFTARAFGRLLVQYEVPAFIASSILQMTTNYILVWLLILTFLLITGMFMETLATIMLITPVLLPIMVGLGVDPIHFGIVLVVACEVGFQTPPLGENLFIAGKIADTTLEDVSLKAIPFSIATIVALLIMVFFPQLSLWLPSILGM